MPLPRALAPWVVLAGAAAAAAAVRAEDAAKDRAGQRRAMVREQIRARGIRDARVLAALEQVPRHLFIPEAHRDLAYRDHPVSIGRGQTISQPYIVALQAQALGLRGGERVLEVGSGSGYLAAVLSLLAADVYGIELEDELFHRSEQVLARLGRRNVHLRCGDGSRGWPEAAPFDAIVVSCAAERVPEALWVQLAPGGRLLLPQGPPWGVQELVLWRRGPDGTRTCTRLLPVMFVPLRQPEVTPR